MCSATTKRKKRELAFSHFRCMMQCYIPPRGETGVKFCYQWRCKIGDRPPSSQTLLGSHSVLCGCCGTTSGTDCRQMTCTHPSSPAWWTSGRPCGRRKPADTSPLSPAYDEWLQVESLSQRWKMDASGKFESVVKNGCELKAWVSGEEWLQVKNDCRWRMAACWKLESVVKNDCTLKACVKNSCKLKAWVNGEEWLHFESLCQK